MSLSFDLNEAIVKNLPAQMSKVLQDRLALVDKLETERKSLDEMVVRLNEVVGRLQARENRYADLEEREKLLIHNEAFLKEEQWKLKVLAAEFKGRDQARQDNLEIVKAVFANSKLKYFHQDSANSFANGMSTNANHIINGEKEV